ncbi:hypothetical protein J4438_02545 [Candidatus Woesearchaeota archaeon]|nr:hypothetical protein [Candidatus Woesearchaeota archaeon]
MKRGILPLIVILLLVSMPFVSAQTYSTFNKFTDNIKLFFASGDNKVRLALEIREKEVNSAVSNLESGNEEKAENELNSASKKLEMVQNEASPDISDEVKTNIDELMAKLNENQEKYELLKKYLNDEEKTKLSMNLSEKIFNYCNELAMQDYESMQKDEKCKSYSWMESKVKQRLEKEQEESEKEIESQIQICMNNPKKCNCDNIKITSGRKECEEQKALAIRCEFQNDNSACKKIGIEKSDDTEREEYEKQIIEKYLPAECSEAGVRSGEECKQLILTLNQPETECIDNGEYVGEQKCQEKLIEENKVLNECVVDGKIVDQDQCLNIVKEGNKPTGEEWELMSGECKERGVFDPIACEEIVNLPRPCKDAGYYTKKECAVLTLNQNMPKECVDAGALTPEACEKLRLPDNCQGEAFSREECETVMIQQNFPDECKSAGEFDTEKCAVIMVGTTSVVVTPGAEMEYLVRQGLTFEEIPSICLNDKNFIRSMDCDAELAKLGITLPTPTNTGTIPKECMIDERTAVSPQECQNKIENNIIVDTIPEECRNEGVTDPAKCGNLIEEKRVEEGIGINMPQECLGISVEECKTVMQEKGIKFEKIEQVQKVEKIDKVERMCKEGETCEKEYEEITLPNECIEVGVGDINNCEMIVGKINEERIKNGEKVILDEEGQVDYINPEQIEKIADESEKKSQEIQSNTEQVQELGNEVKNMEQEMNKFEEKNQQDDNSQVDSDDNNEVVSDENNEVDNSNDDQGNNEDSGNENNVEVSEGSDSGNGEGNVVVSGEVVKNLQDKTALNFLEFFRKVFLK